MSSSSSNSKAKRSAGIQGKRPQPLSLLTTRPSKKPRVAGIRDGGQAGPVIIYERTPRIIQAGPDEFMSIVQRLTGKQQSFSSTAATLLEAEATSGARDDDGTSTSAAAEALVLALGQHQQQRAPCGDDRPGPSSTSPGAGSSLLSPSSFIFSPATMQAIRELLSPSANLVESAW
uniref:Uncharacterized protein n=1 Tax=Avena sativa TaxID=4498 RepID=A0ACD5UYR3_AVESA